MKKDDLSPNWEITTCFGLLYACLFTRIEVQLLPKPILSAVDVSFIDISLVAANTLIILLIRYIQVYKKVLSASTVANFAKLLGFQWSFLLVFALFIWPNEIWLRRVFPVRGLVDSILAGTIPMFCSLLIIFTAQAWYLRNYPNNKERRNDHGPIKETPVK